MHILIVSCTFPPEPTVSAATSADIATSLVERGHRVTVISNFPNRPGGKVFPGHRRKWTSAAVTSKGYRLIRCYSTLSMQSHITSRFIENLTFGVSGAWAALTAGRPDAVYANTWPVFASGLICLTARLRHIPMVVSVQDMYPESIISQGRLARNHRFVRWMRGIDNWIVRNSDSVIVASGSFADTYRNDRGLEHSRMHIVPNWIHSDESRLGEAEGRAYRQLRDIPETAWVCAYGGNIGAAAGVETLIQSIALLKHPEPLRLLVAGEGSRLVQCRKLAESTGTGGILFHSPWAVEDTYIVLKAADFFVLPTRGRQSLASMPSKLISYLLAGKPVIALARRESDLAHVVTQCGGWIVEPERPDLLAQKIDEIMHLSKEDLAGRGQTGRDYALKHFSKEACVPRVIDIIEQAGSRSGGILSNKRSPRQKPKEGGTR